MAATVHVTLNNVLPPAVTGTMASVPDSQPLAVATVTSTGSSAAVPGITGIAGKFWEITAVGGPVWVKFGTSPVAASNSGHLIADGQSRAFNVLATGETVAVKDAP